MGYIAGIGGANMDVHGRSDRALVMRDSNPGTLHMSMGGVCRNICENLARLKHDVRLCTVLGNDVNGRTIMEGCMACGIDMSHTKMLDGERTSSYISLMDEAGDMLLAMSDMHIIKRLDERLVDDVLEVLLGADLVVCDGNLSGRTLERLTSACDRPLYLDPVSTAWAKELAPWIGFFDTVKPNRMELEALSGCPCDTKEHLTLACDILRGKGVRRVFVSLGSEGMFYRGPEGTIERKNRKPLKMVNATGAGDAAMAGIIHADSLGRDAEGAVYSAMAAGMIAVMSEDTISGGMNPDAVENTIKEYIL